MTCIVVHLDKICTIPPRVMSTKSDSSSSDEGQKPRQEITRKIIFDAFNEYKRCRNKGFTCRDIGERHGISSNKFQRMVTKIEAAIFQKRFALPGKLKLDKNLAELKIFIPFYRNLIATSTKSPTPGEIQRKLKEEKLMQQEKFDWRKIEKLIWMSTL